jgi:hypothetical protein
VVRGGPEEVEVIEFTATDRVKICRYTLGAPVYVGTLAREVSTGETWVGFKVEEDAEGRNVYFRAKDEA